MKEIDLNLVVNRRIIYVFLAFFLLANLLFFRFGLITVLIFSHLIPLIISGFMIYLQKKIILKKPDLKMILRSIFFILFIFFVYSMILRFFQIIPPKNNIVNVIENSSLVQKIILFLLITIIAPIYEEIIFRRTIFEVMKDSFLPKYAIYITSFLFAIIHFQLLFFIPIFFIGIILQMTYFKTQNLLNPVIIHSIFNGVMFLSTLLK